ncbi:hypothetical protein CHARACLAT_016159 [Characodon lateralis]|uniref:Uncharacterized protein n=1 Tax=Characodon lateralis TaxID=208331 RepID=A0ABU7DAW9_9TELE|nr:hypothetical protein [Characodon lateralis]
MILPGVKQQVIITPESRSSSGKGSVTSEFWSAEPKELDGSHGCSSSDKQNGPAPLKAFKTNQSIIKVRLKLERCPLCSLSLQCSGPAEGPNEAHLIPDRRT